MEHTLAFHLIKTSRQLQNVIGFKSTSVALSSSEASALLIIDSQKEISQIEIALKLHLKPASVVSLVDELEKLKLVSRSTIKKDRRKYQIQLTEKGVEQVKEIRKLANKLESFIRSKLSKEEVTTLFLALEKISNTLESWPNEINIAEYKKRKGVKNEKQLPNAKPYMAS